MSHPVYNCVLSVKLPNYFCYFNPSFATLAVASQNMMLFKMINDLLFESRGVSSNPSKQDGVGDVCVHANVAYV